MFKQGFTLTELVIIMGILIGLFALTTGASFSTITQSQAGTTAQTIIADLRATQTRAMTGSTPSSTPVSGWGIYYEADRYTIFSGTTYLPGAPSNVVITLPTNVTITANPSTIVFKSLSGELNSPTPAPTLVVTAGGTNRTITLNPLGVPDVTP